MRAKKYAAVAASLTALAGAGLAAAPAAGQNQSVTVTDVVAKVNRAGGITVSGAMDCAQAVPSAAPPIAVQSYRVMVSVTWTATQAVGRKSRVTASWTGGGHADSCYNSWDPQPTYLPWNTSWYGSTGTDYYVVPPNGKFVKGPVLVDVTVNSFYDEQGNPVPNVYQTNSDGDIIGQTDSVAEVFGVTQFAVRAR